MNSQVRTLPAALYMRVNVCPQPRTPGYHYVQAITVQTLWINQFILEPGRRLLTAKAGIHQASESQAWEAVVSLFVNFVFLNVNFRFPLWKASVC